MNKKTGMTAVCLLKVRELRQKLAEANERAVMLSDANDGLRKANEHCSHVCHEAQAGERVLKAALDRCMVDRDDLQAELRKYEGWVYNTDQLNIVLEKKNIEISALQLHANAIREGALKTNAICNAELDKRNVKIANLMTELGERVKQLQSWINNPVNVYLEGHNRTLSDRNRHFYIQGIEFRNQRDQLLAQLKEEQDFKGVQGKEIDSLMDSLHLTTESLDQRDRQLGNARARIAELEAAMNYFNGLHQTGEDHVSSIERERNDYAHDNDNLRTKLTDLTEALQRSRAFAREIEIDRDKFAKLWMNYRPQPSALSKLWSWLTKL